MSTYFLLQVGLLAIFFTSVSTSIQNSGVLDKIKTGLEYASSYIDTAKEIADLVSKSLGNRNQKRGDDGERNGEILEEKKNSFGTHSLTSAFFRLLGLDLSKINAIAVNSVIFLAQMIGTAFNLKSQKEKPRGMEFESKDTDEPEEEENLTEGPMRLILDSKNERIQNLISQARDSNLPNYLIERLDGFDTECIRLFVCKASPVIWAAQRSLKNDSTTTTNRVKWDMTSWLPTKDEFQENGDKCEENYTGCKLFPK